MERIRTTWETAVATYKASRARQQQRHSALESSQGFSKASNADQVNNPLMKLQKPKRKELKGRKKAFVWACLLLNAILVYLFVFFALDQVGDAAVKLHDKFTSTISKTYTTISEKYEDLRNPGSVEEVAGLMTDFYELLAEMGYYEQEDIHRAPHTNPSINASHATKLGLSSKVVELLQELPYVGPEGDFEWSYGAGDSEFLLSGVFADWRGEDSLENNVDPLYALAWGEEETKGFDEDGGRYMKPDYICLSLLGNHGAVMILNVRNFRLWTIDQIMGNADEKLENVRAKGDDDNYNSLDNQPARPARLALSDYMQKFKNLEWMPGGLINNTWEGDEYARLYRENGWPTTYNRTAFKLARLQWLETEQLRWEAERPFEEFQKFETWLEHSLRIIDENQQAVSDVDAGKEIPNNQPAQARLTEFLPDRPDRFADRAKYRKGLIDEIDSNTAGLPKLRHDLEAARKSMKAVDSKVRKAREDRIAKYGY